VVERFLFDQRERLGNYLEQEILGSTAQFLEKEQGTQILALAVCVPLESFLQHVSWRVLRARDVPLAERC
jgi:hypothetical protein